MSRFALILLAAAAALAQPGPEPAVNSAFTAREVEWAAAALPLMLSQPAIAEVDREAAQYVTDLGRQLAPGVPPQRTLPYRLILYDDQTGLDVPYFGWLRHRGQTVTLPGGIVLVPVSLFRTSTNEREFAREVARGIAHVTLRHVYRLAQVGPLIRPVPPADPLMRAERERLFTKSWLFTRRMEQEADVAAGAILSRVQLGPAASQEFETLKSRLGGGRTVV